MITGNNGKIPSNWHKVTVTPVTRVFGVTLGNLHYRRHCTYILACGRKFGDRASRMWCFLCNSLVTNGMYIHSGRQIVSFVTSALHMKHIILLCMCNVICARSTTARSTTCAPIFHGILFLWNSAHFIGDSSTEIQIYRLKRALWASDEIPGYYPKTPVYLPTIYFLLSSKTTPFARNPGQ